MYPAQATHPEPVACGEIATCVVEILRLGSKIVSTQRFQLQFIVFPLFMAGFASVDTADKMRASELMGALEQQSIGQNTCTIRQLLHDVYEAQNMMMMSTGSQAEVDWVQIMIGRGLQVVNFGL